MLHSLTSGQVAASSPTTPPLLATTTHTAASAAAPSPKRREDKTASKRFLAHIQKPRNATQLAVYQGLGDRKLQAAFRRAWEKDPTWDFVSMYKACLLPVCFACRFFIFVRPASQLFAQERSYSKLEQEQDQQTLLTMAELTVKLGSVAAAEDFAQKARAQGRVGQLNGIEHFAWDTRTTSQTIVKADIKSVKNVREEAGSPASVDEVPEAPLLAIADSDHNQAHNLGIRCLWRVATPLRIQNSLSVATLQGHLIV